jgi:enolase
MTKIESIKGLEILDSRGRPTVKAYLTLENGASAAVSVPSGASTGKSEAHELRDGEARYQGMGCRQAVSNINDTIAKSLVGRSFSSQQDFDHHLLKLDGSSNKSNLGANAVLAASLVFARATAINHSQPLYRYFAQLAGTELEFLPRPTINLFSGGKHAGGQVPIQDLLMVPGQDTVGNLLECAYQVFQAAASICQQKYGMRMLTADEGGLAPPFADLNDMFEDAIDAIEQAGFQPGKEVALAVDAASSQFFSGGRYRLGEQTHDSLGMIEVLKEWIHNFPIASIEDGLDEEDWKHWPILCSVIGKSCLVLGDDFLCTNPERIKRAVETKSANALLLKVNQIGSITEALKSLTTARNAGWHVTISARSGETEDNWLADLAVGWQAEHIKIGSITQSERLSKYNRLLEIEQELQLKIKN